MALNTVGVVRGEELKVTQNDSFLKVLAGRTGKRITLRFMGGEELTGKVVLVTPELVHLGELSGRDYFDAVVERSKIVAIIVRVKE